MTHGDLTALLHQINKARMDEGFPDTALERKVESRFQSSRKLAVYGTLSPGEVNASVLGSIDGSWHKAEVEGIRFLLAQGMDIGFPGFHWIPGGPTLAVHLLVAPDLPNHWSRLDRFEGPDYCRILVPAYRNNAFHTVTNIYQCRHPAP